MGVQIVTLNLILYIVTIVTGMSEMDEETHI